MLTTESTSDAFGRVRRRSVVRRATVTTVLLALTAGSFAATAAPAMAVDRSATPLVSAAKSIAVEPFRLEAETFSSNNGGGTKAESGQDADGASLGNVGGTWDGAELYFDDVDFGAVPRSTVTVRYVNNSSRVGANPSLEFYVDEKTDENKVATVALPVTGSNWDAYDALTVDLDAAIHGSHKLIVVMKVTADAEHPYVGNFDYFEFGAPAVDVPDTFIGAETLWKYSDDNTDPSPSSLEWTTAEFDDAAWTEAPGAFGAKNNSATPDLGANFPVETVLAHYIDGNAAPTIPTYHFRTDFDITAEQIGVIEGLQGSVTYDDAARIYVNGEKVAGFVDERAGDSNLAYAGASNGDPVTSDFTIPAEALVPGENQIAIAVFQDRETSSDAYFDVKSLAPVEKQGEEPEVPALAISDIVLGVGASEQERNLAWYSNQDVPQVAQLAKASEMADGAFPETAEVFETTAGGSTTSGEFFRDATLSGLEQNTEYAYRVGSEESGWSEAFTFRTQEFDGAFDFLFFGDPQVGASGNLANDEAGWIDTLNVASNSYPDAELLFSAGDQVESAGNEDHYTTFLKPTQMREIPVVATNGNHDVGSKAYEQHYNLPNEDLTAGPASSGTASGGDYWFIYKDVLFVNINSNSRDYASHNAFLEKVVAEQGDKVKWKMLAFHHSIYSAAVHATDGDIIDRRNNMPQTISQLGFDMVLMGHDHHYTRSYLIKDGELADSEEQAAADEVVAEPGEVLYVTANSASGSKYYNLNTGIDLWWSSVRNQERVRNYSAIEVTDESITVRTLRSQANGAANPVNSVVDEVVLRKAEVTNDLNVSVSASTRSVAGTQYVSVAVKNDEAAPVDVVVETPYGSKTFTDVQPGKSANVLINSRIGSIPAGEVTVSVTGQSGGESITVEKSAAYPAAG